MNSSRSYKLRPGLAVLLTVIVTFFLCCMVMFLLMRKESDREIQRRVESDLSSMLNYIEEEFYTYARLSTVTINQNRTLLHNPDSAYKMCELILEKSPVFCAVSVQYVSDYFPDRKGFMPVVESHQDGRLFRYDASDPQSSFYFDYLAEDDDFYEVLQSHVREWAFGKQTSGRYSSLPIIGTCLPVYDDKGDPVAVVNTIISTEHMAAQLQSFSPYEGGQVCMIEAEKDKIFINPDPSLDLTSARKWLSETFGESVIGIVDNIKDYEKIVGTSGGVYYNYIGKSPDGKDMLTICMDEKYHLITVYSCPVSGIMEGDRRIFHWTILCFLVSMLIILATCYLNMLNISKRAAKEASLRKDIQTAAAIQKSLLPKPLVGEERVEVDARLVPARHIGGDLFNYFVKDGSLYFCIGDVAGKGIPASIFMSKSITLFHTLAPGLSSVSELVGRLNDELCMDNDTHMFVTLFAGRLDFDTGILTYCSAGHEKPLCCDGNPMSLPVFLPVRPNLPLGAMPGRRYQEQSVQLGKDGFILLYTDGVTDAKHSAKGRFGAERIALVCQHGLGRSAEQIGQELMDSIDNFVAGEAQADDIAILTIRYKG